MNNFAIFIMVHGRPDKMWTYQTLRKHGYTGKIYLVADDLDPTVDQYKKKYEDELLVFDKELAATKMDAGDNSHDLRSTLYSSNTIFDLAKDLGLKHFMIMCDDYTHIAYKFNTQYEYQERYVLNLDKVLKGLVEFYDKTPALTIALAQNGDFIGGRNSGFADELKMKRKAMNTFLCSTERPFKFIGRLNEDVTTYVNLGSRGELFFTIPNVSISQKTTQHVVGGLTDAYLDSGTYVKSFFSVMYNPSSIKVAQMGDKHKRLHHRVSWNNAVPVIVSEDYKKV